MSEVRIVVKPLTVERWADFESVMGEKGGASGCWCMHWRIPSGDFHRMSGTPNREAMAALAQRDVPPGLLGYLGDQPVAWCSLGRRDDYPRMGRSRVMRGPDDEPVCAIACLFVHKKHRRRGLSRALLEAACVYAAEQGFRIVEGYPVDPPPGKRLGADTAMTGLASVFRAVGFDEVARHKFDRPVMRKLVARG